MKSQLAEKKCSPCEKGAKPLKGESIAKLRGELKDDWKVIGEHHLEKEYTFSDFKEALDFTNRVGAIAEEEQHHPDIFLGWGKVKLDLWTHNIGGLSENDFILAAKSDEAR
ncbi:MAG TPA: 4a-hydroxytetrahydrobiopterin dehydratase [Verrucomicrobiae bacterium]|nr:4a-hydroxytetrahydrobiopterin dehydratase [Verrucomicrobiae bacterium]